MLADEPSGVRSHFDVLDMTTPPLATSSTNINFTLPILTISVQIETSLTSISKIPHDSFNQCRFLKSANVYVKLYRRGVRD